MDNNKIETLAVAFSQRLAKLKRAVYINTNSKAHRKVILARADELAATAGLMSWFFFENDQPKRDAFMAKCGMAMEGMQRGAPNFKRKALQ